MLTLILGGVRSGKSRMAERPHRCERTGANPYGYRANYREASDAYPRRGSNPAPSARPLSTGVRAPAD